MQIYFRELIPQKSELKAVLAAVAEAVSAEAAVIMVAVSVIMFITDNEKQAILPVFSFISFRQQSLLLALQLHMAYDRRWNVC